MLPSFSVRPDPATSDRHSDRSFVQTVELFLNCLRGGLQQRESLSEVAFEALLHDSRNGGRGSCLSPVMPTFAWNSAA